MSSSQERKAFALGISFDGKNELLELEAQLPLEVPDLIALWRLSFQSSRY